MILTLTICYGFISALWGIAIGLLYKEHAIQQEINLRKQYEEFVKELFKSADERMSKNDQSKNI